MAGIPTATANVVPVDVILDGHKETQWDALLKELNHSNPEDVRFCVLGSSADFGEWGLAKSPTKAIATRHGDQWSVALTSVEVGIADDAGTAVEFRIAVVDVNKGYILAVDAAKTKPSVDHLSEGMPSRLVIHYNLAMCSFKTAKQLPGLAFLRSPGPVLRLNVFPRPNFSFHHHLVEDQCEDVDDDEDCPIPTVDTRVRVKGATVVPSRNMDWELATMSSSVQEALRLANIEEQGPLENPNDAIVAPVTRVAPVRGQRQDGQGIRNTRTMEYWTLSANIIQLHRHALRLSVVCTAPKHEGEAPDTERECRGSVLLVPAMFRDAGSHGSFTVPVHMESLTMEPVCVYISYAVVTPCFHSGNSLRLVRSVEAENIVVEDGGFFGHRGLGKTYTHANSNIARSKLSENTFESIAASRRRGATMCEFDVMLTQDNVPILSHDAIVNVRGSLDTRTGGSPRGFNPVPIGLHKMTLAEMSRTRMWALPKGKVYRLRGLMLRHWDEIVGRLFAERFPDEAAAPERMRRRERYGDRPLGEIWADPLSLGAGVPTLRSMFQALPIECGLAMELKFPFQPSLDAHLYLQTDHFEINRFVDKILHDLLDCCQFDRNVVLCSFDPSICIALLAKQARYPVMYICDGEDETDQKDYRCIGVEAGIQFCVAEGLTGISLSSKTLLGNEQKTTPKRSESLPTSPSAPDAFVDATVAKRGSPADPSPTPMTRAWQRWFPEAEAMPPLSSVDAVLADVFAHGRDIMTTVRKHNLKSWTWGGVNDDHCWGIIQLRALGVGAVITDNVPHWAADVRPASLTN